MDTESIAQIMLFLNEYSQNMKYLVIGYIKHTSQRLNLYLPSIIFEIIIAIYHLFYVPKKELVSIARLIHKHYQYFPYVPEYISMRRIIKSYIKYQEEQFSLRMPSIIFMTIQSQYYHYYVDRSNLFALIYYKHAELHGISELNQIIQHLIYDLASYLNWIKIDVPTSDSQFDMIKFKYSGNNEYYLNVTLNLKKNTISINITPIDITWESILYTEIANIIQNVHHLMNKK